MFVSFVLNVEYMDISSRSKWYLKNLLHAKDNKWIVVTHEYLKNHIEELQKDITPSLFDSWEMRPFEINELNEVEQYTIQDALFDGIESALMGRTEMLSSLYSSRCPEFEGCLHEIFKQIQMKHPDEKIEGVFHCLAAFRSLIEVCKELGLPLIQYSFSAFRKANGYKQTQFFTALDGSLYCQDECKRHYANFLADESRDSLPVFSNRELIAIFGKDRTLPLIPLMNHEPQYEMGVCCECFSVLPQFFFHEKVTDDDVFYQTSKLYRKDQTKVRSHSIQLDQIQVDRTTQHNDPAPFLLSCRRLVAARSQIMLKAMLWKRTAIMPRNTLDFSFACEKDFSSTRLADVRFLNYYFIGYAVPAGLMFSDEYWRWRLTNPSEVEVFAYHLDYYLKQLSIEKSIIDITEEPSRFELLLHSHNCDEELIPLLVADDQNFDVDYFAATSKFVVDGKAHWRLNKKIDNGNLICKLRIRNISINEFEFYPFDDVAGFANLNSVIVNGKMLVLSDEQKGYNYMKKVRGHYCFYVENTNDLSIEIVWQYKKVFEYLNE